jgi:predicted nucleic acid-binding protein
MKAPKVYLDTSIFNLALDDKNPDKRDLTRQFFAAVKSGKYEVFISDIVMLEINEALPEIAAGLKRIITEVNPKELIAEREVYELARKYVEMGIIPARYEDDALHIAVASVNNLDLIISWNFEHIVKYKTKTEVIGVNAIAGYKSIEIYSPQEVV